MSKAISKSVIRPSGFSKIQDYKMLVKFNLTTMVVMTAGLGYLIAAGLSFDLATLVLLIIGGYCVSGAANGINQVLEKEYDAQMERTMKRPLAASRMTTSEGVLFSGLVLVIGIICLGLINPITAFIGMCSFVLYAFVYTPLKRYSTISVAIGAIPGALPALLGVLAHEASFTLLGISLFFIQFLWQFPHFWSIAYNSFDDYDNAGYKLLPKDEDGKVDRNLGIYSALYSLLIIPVVVGAHFMGLEINLFCLAAVIICTLAYTWMGLRLQWNPSRKTALGLMFSSFAYLPIVLILYLVG